MVLAVSETLKLILGGELSVGRTMQPALLLGDRLDLLFDALHQTPPPRPPHEIEDDIWAIWIAHDVPALEARMQRAISAIARRRFLQAENLLDSLVREAPDWAEAWNKRATLYYLQRRDAESLSDIRHTLQLEPRHFGAICGFGQICLRNGERAAAAGAFAAALALNPHLDGVRLMLDKLESGPPARLN